jgi:hypothetical protein
MASPVSSGVQAKPKTAPRPCLFCDANANSPEHMWSDWMRPYFPRTAHDKSIETHWRVTPGETREGSRRILHGHSTTRKLKTVCAPCNNGWMSRLEMAAKPILEPMMRGEPVALAEAQQRILTQWLTLKMMVWEQTDPRARLFKRTETLAFARDRSLPEALRIWLFRTRIPHFARVTRSFTALVEAGQVVGPEAANVQTVLFGAGQFVAFILHTRLPQVEIAKHRQVFARPLWPIWRPVLKWPPARVLDAAQIDYLGDTLNRWVVRFRRVAEGRYRLVRNV